jgi:antitoxin VapB
MRKVAKLFLNGKSQAVRLPREFRFEGTQVWIRKDARTGDVILSARPNSWKDWFQELDEIPAKEREEFADFLLALRDEPLQPGERDPFRDWQE